MTEKTDQSISLEQENVLLRAQVAELTAQLATTEQRLQEMGIADAITGLFSYRYFVGRMTEEVVRADRFSLEVSCLLVGLDTPSFEGLLEVSRMLRESSRQYDITARWSQNELAMLLPATDLDGAQIVAERFRILVEETFRDHPTLKGLTVSVGVASYPSRSVEDAKQILEAADGALHAAGKQGGNRTMVRD